MPSILNVPNAFSFLKVLAFFSKSSFLFSLALLSQVLTPSYS